MPRKNIRDFRGAPLIAHTIRAAVDTGLFARVIVSTDDEEIASIATGAGAEVPFLRDPGLADDITPVSAATADALTRIDPDGNEFESVCQLMPNCPLRNAADIADSHAEFHRSRPPAQVSLVRYGWQNPWWALELDEHNRVKPLFEDRLLSRSQDLPALFCPTGAVWWAAADVLRETKTFHVDDRAGWEIRWEHAVDIDTEDDWLFAELVHDYLALGR